jgi:DNA primase
MRIGKPELEALKRGVDLVALVREHGVELKRTGKSYSGRCPFHSPDKNPSFVVDPEKNLWKCFGACASNGKSGGDAIAFLMKKESIPFREAYERLLGNGHGNGSSGSASSSKSPTSRREKPDWELVSEEGSPEIEASPATLTDAERAHLLGAVADHYQATLAKAPRAQGYLKRRGLLVPEVLRAMRVGYADGSLLEAVAPKGILREQLVAAGVLSATGYEMLSGMVVVPLLDPGSGAVVQLYGRSITGRRHHYLKGELRGLLNPAVAMTSEELVLVESVVDALSLLVLGIPNVVALYGTNGWTRDHDRLLADGAVKRVTLLLDSDEAGKKAAAVLGERLARRGLGVRVATLADAKDPNEVLTNGMTGDAMREVLDAAVPVAGAAVVEPPAPSPPTRYEVEDLAEGFKLVVGPRRYWARAIRGGAYERLEVTLRLEDGYGEYVDRLDLYNGRSRRGFALRVARRFHLDEDLIERELIDLVSHQAEAWVAAKAKREEANPGRPKAPELTEEEKAEALAFLKDPQLLERTAEHLTRLGYVGEETNKVLGYLTVVSRKLEAPLSAVILSQSAAGKSGLAELLEKVTPPEDVYFFSRLTPSALYYMEKDELVRKVVIIEERSGSEEADYSIRTLQSRKKLILAVPMKDPRTGKTKTVIREVDGPAVFLQTTTALEVNHENLTRCFEIYLDESEEQTRRIHDSQRRLRTLEGQREAEEAKGFLKLHWNAQRLLRRVLVDIPWVGLLSFPASWLRTRRDHDRFLNLIEASAFLHQHQRPTPKGAEPGQAIEATVEDYRIAYALAGEVLGTTLADLKKPARELVQAMAALVKRLAREGRVPPERVTVSRRQVRESTGLPDHQVRRLLDELVSLEHLEQVRGGQGKLCLYRLPAGGAGDAETVLAGLVKPEELAKRLGSRPRLARA